MPAGEMAVIFVHGLDLPRFWNSVFLVDHNTHTCTCTGLARDDKGLLCRQFPHPSNGGPVPVMGPVMISTRSRLSWWGASSVFFLLVEVRVQRCAETPRSRVKSTQRTPPSSSPWSTSISKVRSPSPHSQPTSETFALKKCSTHA